MRTTAINVEGLRTVPGLNAREHWAVKARRVKAERLMTRGALAERGRPPDGPWQVELCRVAPRRCDDDNLQGALKAVRDEVAAWLGVDDGSELITFRYSQLCAPAEVVDGVRIPKWGVGIWIKRRLGRPPKMAAGVMAMRKRGDTLQAIGRRYGVTRQAVWSAIQRRELRG